MARSGAGKAALFFTDIFMVASAALLAVAGFFTMREAVPELPAWAVFVGRLHPVLLHLPLGALVLMAIVEVVRALRKKEALDGFLMFLATVTALLAAICGLALAQEGGYDSPRLTYHMWLGIGAYAALVLTFLLRLRVAPEEYSGPGVYRCMLVLSAVVIGAAGHFGGTITHGADFLSEHADEAMASLGLKPMPAEVVETTSTGAYAKNVAPILDKYCVECHGPEKQKHGIRLDSLEGLRTEQEELGALYSGTAENSLIIKVMRLPLDEDDHMPPSGKPQPADAEIAVIERWINAGGDENVPAFEILPSPPVENVPSEPIPSEELPEPVEVVPEEVIPENTVSEPEENAEPVSESAVSVIEEMTGQPVDFIIEGEVTPEQLAEMAEQMGAAPEAIENAEVPTEESETSQPESTKSLIEEMTGQPLDFVIEGNTPEEIIRAMSQMNPADSTSEEVTEEVVEVEAPVVEGAYAVQIAPILEAKCVECHGPDKQEHGIRVDSLERLLQERQGSPLVQPGNASESLLIKVLRLPMEDEHHMPPRDKAQITQEEEMLLAFWINLGASADIPVLIKSDVDVQNGPVVEDVSPEEPETVTYTEHVAPILESKCYGCHGGGRQRGGVRLDSVEAMLQGNWDGPVLVPGDGAASLLAQVLEAPAGAENHMPPGNRPQPTAEEIALIKQWVKSLPPAE